MGSDGSHFNVSVGSDGQSHKTVSTNDNLFVEKGEPKRYRTEVLPLTSLMLYREAKPAHGRCLQNRGPIKGRHSCGPLDGFQARSKDQEILEEGGGAGPSLLPRRDHE